MEILATVLFPVRSQICTIPRIIYLVKINVRFCTCAVKAFFAITFHIFSRIHYAICTQKEVDKIQTKIAIYSMELWHVWKMTNKFALIPSLLWRVLPILSLFRRNEEDKKNVSSATQRFHVLDLQFAVWTLTHDLVLQADHICITLVVSNFRHVSLTSPRHQTPKTAEKWQFLSGRYNVWYFF